MTDRETDTSDDFKPSDPRAEKALVCIIQVWLLIVTRGWGRGGEGEGESEEGREGREGEAVREYEV